MILIIAEKEDFRRNVLSVDIGDKFLDNFSCVQFLEFSKLVVSKMMNGNFIFFCFCSGDYGRIFSVILMLHNFLGNYLGDDVGLSEGASRLQRVYRDLVAAPSPPLLSSMFSITFGN